MNKQEYETFYRDKGAWKMSESWGKQLAATSHPQERVDAVIRLYSGEEAAFKKAERDHPGVEPVDWALFYIMQSWDGYDAAKALKETNVAVLNLEPDINPIGSNPDRVLYNSLAVTNYLFTDLAANPIQGIYRRAVMDASYQDFDLKQVLGWGMRMHQPDTRYYPEWKKVLESQTDTFVPFTPDEAF